MSRFTARDLKARIGRLHVRHETLANLGRLFGVARNQPRRWLRRGVAIPAVHRLAALLDFDPALALLLDPYDDIPRAVLTWLWSDPRHRHILEHLRILLCDDRALYAVLEDRITAGMRPTTLRRSLQRWVLLQAEQVADPSAERLRKHLVREDRRGGHRR